MLLRKNDSGRSIVEMLGVLAIMGVITVMGIAGYSQAIGKINRNKTVEEIVKIAQEVRGIFAGRTNYNETEEKTDTYDIGTSILEKMGMSLSAPYGGKYVVKSFGSSGNNPGFSVTLGNIPQSDCLQFMTMAWTDVLKADGATPGTSAYFGDGTSLEAATSETCPAGNNALASMTLYFR